MLMKAETKTGNRVSKKSMILLRFTAAVIHSNLEPQDMDDTDIDEKYVIV